MELTVMVNFKIVTTPSFEKDDVINWLRAVTGGDKEADYKYCTFALLGIDEVMKFIPKENDV